MSTRAVHQSCPMAWGSICEANLCLVHQRLDVPFHMCNMCNRKGCLSLLIQMRTFMQMNSCSMAVFLWAVLGVHPPQPPQYLRHNSGCRGCQWGGRGISSDRLGQTRANSACVSVVPAQNCWRSSVADVDCATHALEVCLSLARLKAVAFTTAEDWVAPDPSLPRPSQARTRG